MKVKCVKLEEGGLQGKGRVVRSLSIGKEYSVLEVEGPAPSSLDPRVRFRVVTDDDMPALFPVELFDVLNERVPEDWVFIVDKTGMWTLCPWAFSGEGFWDSYFDEPTQEFNTVEQLIAAADGNRRSRSDGAPAAAMPDAEMLAIEKRNAGATDGPWYVIDEGNGTGTDFIRNQNGGIFLRGATKGDVELIANARQDTVTLLNEVKRLKKLLGP